MARLKQLGSGGALQQKMLSKSADIVMQVGKEIDNMAVIFHENKVTETTQWASCCTYSMH